MKPKRQTDLITIAYPSNTECMDDMDFRLGFLEEAKANRQWRIVMPEFRIGEQDPGFDDGEIAAAIVPANNLLALKQLRKRKIPILLTEPYPKEARARRQTAGLPAVRLDSRAVGRLAADYFISRGYRSFAYVDEPNGHLWADERREAFVAAINTVGHKVSVYGNFSEAERKSWPVERPRMIAWLKTLDKPTAIFAAMDGRARFVIDACRRAGLIVPDEIAILGVDDNKLICKSCNPTLSSIHIDSYHRGRRAAEVLARLIESPQSRIADIICLPAAVMTRESTAYGATELPTLAKGLKFIRQNAFSGRLAVSDVARAMGCSRRYAEIAFSRHIGLTIGKCIADTRIGRVKDLLRNTSLPLAEIAGCCGFAYESNLATTFRRETGVTMKAWRQNRTDVSNYLTTSVFTSSKVRAAGS